MTLCEVEMPSARIPDTKARRLRRPALLAFFTLLGVGTGAWCAVQDIGGFGANRLALLAFAVAGYVLIRTVIEKTVDEQDDYSAAWEEVLEPHATLFAAGWTLSFASLTLRGDPKPSIDQLLNSAMPAIAVMLAIAAVIGVAVVAVAHLRRPGARVEVPKTHRGLVENRAPVPSPDRTDRRSESLLAVAWLGAISAAFLAAVVTIHGLLRMREIPRK